MHTSNYSVVPGLNYDPLNTESQDEFLARMKEQDRQRDLGVASSNDAPAGDKSLEERLGSITNILDGRFKDKVPKLDDYLSKTAGSDETADNATKGYNHIGKFYEANGYLLTADKDGIVHIFAPKEHNLKGFKYETSDLIYVVGDSNDTLKTYYEKRIHEWGHGARHKLFHTPEMEEMINSMMTGVGMERYRPLEVQKPMFTSMYGVKTIKELEDYIQKKSPSYKN